MNGENFELQGKNRSNQSWVIHEVLPSGVLKQEYSAYDVQAISLALFDPDRRTDGLKVSNLLPN